MARDKHVNVVIRAKDTASKALGNVKKSLLSLKAVISAGIGLVVLRRGFKEVTEAAAIEENAINDLSTALKNNNELTKENIDILTRHASALQKGTAFGNEQIIELQKELANFGMSTAAIRENTKMVLDLAAAKKIALKTASELVGKAFKGETGTLSRYGIIIEKNLDRVERFTAVQKELNKQFTGAAAAQTKTYAGTMQQLSNVYGDLKESIGAFITQSRSSLEIMKTLTGAVEIVTGWLDRKRKAEIESLAPLASLIGLTKEQVITMRLLGREHVLLSLLDDLKELKKEQPALEKSVQQIGHFLSTEKELAANYEKQVSIIRQINTLKKNPDVINGLNRQLELTKSQEQADKDALKRGLEGVAKNEEALTSQVKKVEEVKTKIDSISKSFDKAATAAQEMLTAITENKIELSDMIDTSKISVDAAALGSEIGRILVKNMQAEIKRTPLNIKSSFAQIED